ncbi:hypothetical protein Ciccas_007144 [Cichlidogyrus casuarinus]|uniref:Uncharacterized protein n=1 Tax=Cichlidogyrus casuarinus TaxID=1844966 RepID=A0ABD2Q3S6_9PLAT
MDNADCIDDYKNGKLLDTPKTSTGVGLDYCPRLNDQLNPVMPSVMFPVGDLEQSQSVEHDIHFKSTYKNDFKDNQTIPIVERMPKAPPLTDVNYVAEFHHMRPKQPGWFRELDPRNQQSEAQEEYSCINSVKSDMITKIGFKPDKQALILSDIITSGRDLNPDLQVNASTKGKLFFTKNMEVLRNLDPYITTTHKDFRHISQEEVKEINKNKIPTYWDSEEVVTTKKKVAYPTVPIPDHIAFQDNPEITRLPYYGKRQIALRNLARHPLITTYSDSYENQGTQLKSFDVAYATSNPFPPFDGLRRPELMTSMYETEYGALCKNSTNVIS